MKKINVVLVGLQFGAYFIGIYKEHPLVGSVGLYDLSRQIAEDASNYYGIEKIYNSFEEVLNDDKVDAVHIVTPIPCHAEQTLKVLNAGKHCACAVPMATGLEEIYDITEAVRRTGKKSMMMETTLYTYQYFYAKEMLDNGEFGKIQFMRGAHYQDMSGWPGYWNGLPPMHYGTHAISPMVGLSGSRIKRVVCFGSGTMDESLTQQYGNPFPVESALFEFENGIKGEATRTLFETAKTYQEAFHIYGSKKSFEWGFADEDNPYITRAERIPGGRGRKTPFEVVEMPNYYKKLPEEIQRFTVGENFDPLNPQKSLIKGAGGIHHGSHPHLVHEFLMSIAEDRKPWIDEVMAGNITAAGICAHISAMKNGESIIVPEF